MRSTVVTVDLTVTTIHRDGDCKDTHLVIINTSVKTINVRVDKLPLLRAT